MELTYVRASVHVHGRMVLCSEMGVNSHGPTKLPLPTNSVKDAPLSEDVIVLAR